MARNVVYDEKSLKTVMHAIPLRTLYAAAEEAD